jgi:hypothetical protein
MESGSSEGARDSDYNDPMVVNVKLETEFQRTIFRIVSLIITWTVGLLSIYIFIDIQPMINQIGYPSLILFGIMFPILLIIAWGAADHQRRTDFEEKIREMNEVDTQNSSTVDKIIDSASSDPLAKEISPSGGAVYKTRGKDPKGVALGGGADTFDSKMPAVDGMEIRTEHMGLEAELVRSTLIKVEADEKAAHAAKISWDESEKNDQELIEAGVERLGDLVGSGHFGGPIVSNSDETYERP